MADDITLLDKSFSPFISAQQIDEATQRVADAINAKYSESEQSPLFLVVLNGAFMYASDLMKKVTFSSEISFVKLASYEGTTSTGVVKTLIGLDEKIVDRDIIIVEDIVDTGNTIEQLYMVLNDRRPKSIRTTCLLFKPNAYQKSITIDFPAIKIENDFVVGYGLDYDGIGRNYPQIYKVKKG